MHDGIDGAQMKGPAILKAAERFLNTETLLSDIY